MKNKNIVILMAIVCIPLSLSCAWSLKRVLPFTNKEETITPHPYTLRNNSSLVINALDGDITITSDSRNLLSIKAIKRGIEDDLALTSMGCSVDNNIATIKTVEKADHNPVTMNYVLMVPKTISKITINSRSGAITITDVSAAVDITAENSTIVITGATKGTRITSQNGTVTLQQQSLPRSASIFIEAMNGNIELTLPKRVKAHMNARTLKGQLTCDIPLTLEPRTTVLNRTAWQRIQREARGMFGSSETEVAPIVIDVTKGNIKVTGKE